MVNKKYVPDRADIVWIDLNPVKGHEQANVRPVFVLSSKKYNKQTGLMLVCPITSRIKGYSFEVAINGGKVTGVILSDQVRSLDWQKRNVRFIQKAPHEIFDEIKENIEILLFE